MRRRLLGAAALVAVLVGLATAPAVAADAEGGAAVTPGELEAVVPANLDTLDAEGAAALLEQLASFTGGVGSAATGGSSSLVGPCGGYAFSYDGDGQLIDAAYDAGDDAAPQDLLSGGQAFTSSNPFKVSSSGSVSYVGFAPAAGEGPKDNSWKVSVGGIGVASGGGVNTKGKNRSAGTMDIGDKLPFSLSVAFSVSGEMTSDLPACIGKGHVEVDGGGLASPAGALGLVLTLGGLGGLLFNARPARTWRQ